MDKLLSIIVPTYNMEKYLHKCLSSLIINDEQLRNRLEVVVVNDGSKDSSSDIAHSFEKEYPGLFIVIDKENGNYGSCINAGIPASSGKYIKVLDADDSFDTFQFEKYLRCICSTDADLIINNKTIVDPNGNITEKCSVDCVPYSILDFDTISSCYQVLDMHKMAYRRNLLIEMGYRQTERVSYSDTEWAVLPFTKINSAVFFPYDVYQYLVGREGQTMDKSVRKKAFKSLKVVEFAIGDYMTEFHSSEQREKFIFDFFSYSILIIYREFFFLGSFDTSEFREFDKEAISRYPKLKPIVDNHKWVSFIPNLQLVKDWRENKRIKFFLEYIIIRLYLKIRHRR